MDWSNDATKPLILALPPRVAARIAVDAAVAADTGVAELSEDLLAANERTGSYINVLRAEHRGSIWTKSNKLAHADRGGSSFEPVALSRARVPEALVARPDGRLYRYAIAFALTEKPHSPLNEAIPIILLDERKACRARQPGFVRAHVLDGVNERDEVWPPGTMQRPDARRRSCRRGTTL